MKCWKSVSNNEGSRLIVALQVGAVKIYVAIVEWRRYKEKERQGETQFTTKTEVPPPTLAY